MLSCCSASLSFSSGVGVSGGGVWFGSGGGCNGWFIGHQDVIDHPKFVNKPRTKSYPQRVAPDNVRLSRAKKSPSRGAFGLGYRALDCNVQINFMSYGMNHLDAAMSLRGLSFNFNNACSLKLSKISANSASVSMNSFRKACNRT